MTVVYKLEVSTRHFTFEVIALTPAECLSAMRRAWRTHQLQTGAALSFAALGLEVTSAQPMILGEVYRDGSVVRQAAGHNRGQLNLYAILADR